MGESTGGVAAGQDGPGRPVTAIWNDDQRGDRP